MLWGLDQVGDFTNNILNTQAQGSPANVLSFNEPDQTGQSAMAVGDAISAWWQYMEQLKYARKGSPAVTNGPTGLAWLKSFMEGCSTCNIDFVCIHYYGTNAADFESVVSGLWADYGKPIWVTEWACQDYSGNNQQCDQGAINAFLSTTQNWLENQSYVERYAWFGALTSFPSGFNSLNALMDSNGNINALGNQYIWT